MNPTRDELWSRPWETISVSQLDQSGFNSQAKERATACSRAYVLQRIYRLGKNDSMSAHFGSHVHAVLEAWVNGTPPDPRSPAANILLPGLRFLTGKTIRQVEREIIVPFDSVSQGLKMIAKIDMDGDTFVGDLKTVGQLHSPYNLTEKTLKDDLQGNIYGHLKMAIEALKEVELFWLYCQTKGFINKFTGEILPSSEWKPAAKAVSVYINAQDAEARADLFATDCGRLKVFRDKKPLWHEVAPAYEHCGAFGGCVFKNICFSQLKGDDMNNLGFLASLITPKTVDVPPVVNLTPDYVPPSVPVLDGLPDVGVPFPPEEKAPKVAKAVKERKPRAKKVTPEVIEAQFETSEYVPPLQAAAVLGYGIIEDGQGTIIAPPPTPELVAAVRKYEADVASLEVAPESKKETSIRDLLITLAHALADHLEK